MPDLDCSQKNSKNDWFFNELKSNRKFLLQTTPLFIGYSIFLLYFIQNDFFPNMDIFNWLSLLIAAFILGVLSLLIIFGLLTFSGYQWKFLIVDDKLLRKQVVICKKNWLLNNRYLRKITVYYLLTPLVINNLLLAFIICTSKTALGITVLFLLLTIALGTISTTILFYQLCLPCKMFFKYVITITVLIFYSSFFCIIISLPIQSNIHQNMSASLTSHSIHVSNNSNKITENPLKIPVDTEGKTLQDYSQLLKINNLVNYIKKYLSEIVFLVSIGITIFIIGVITLSFLDEDKWVSFSVTIILGGLFIFLINMIKWFPEMVVKTINIGNYQASHVYLTPESCQHLKETQLFEISPQCSLENIKVLWNIGGSYVFKVAVNGEQQILPLDKKEIRYVLKSKKPSTACRPQPTEAPVDKSLSHSH